MEIKTPVSVTNVFGNNVLQESDGTFIGDFITTDLAVESAKRINMYNVLIKQLQEVKEFVDWYYSRDSDLPPIPLHEISMNIDSLLEKCK